MYCPHDCTCRCVVTFSIHMHTHIYVHNSDIHCKTYTDKYIHVHVCKHIHMSLELSPADACTTLHLVIKAQPDLLYTEGLKPTGSPVIAGDC